MPEETKPAERRLNALWFDQVDPEDSRGLIIEDDSASLIVGDAAQRSAVAALVGRNQADELGRAVEPLTLRRADFDNVASMRTGGPLRGKLRVVPQTGADDSFDLVSDRDHPKLALTAANLLYPNAKPRREHPTTSEIVGPVIRRLLTLAVLTAALYLFSRLVTPADLDEITRDAAVTRRQRRAEGVGLLLAYLAPAAVLVVGAFESLLVLVQARKERFGEPSILIFDGRPQPGAASKSPPWFYTNFAEPELHHPIGMAKFWVYLVRTTVLAYAISLPLVV